MDAQLFLDFGLALLLGGLIGIEREMPRDKNNGFAPVTEFGGIRAFALIALLGTLCSWIDTVYGSGHTWALAGLALMSIFLVISYTYSSYKYSAASLTSEYAAIVTYIIGLLIAVGSYTIAVILAITITVVLSLKENIDEIKAKISREEFGNTLKFAVVSLVILPILPSQKFSLADGYYTMIGETIPLVGLSKASQLFHMDFFNPHGIWLFVVIMSAVSYAGYILSKTLGAKSGILLSGAIGGLISSTAVTTSMTSQSKEDTHNRSSYVMATLLATCIMFVRVLLIAGFASGGALVLEIAPYIGLMLASFLSVIGYLLIKSFRQKKTALKMNLAEGISSPFSLKPALSFAVLIAFIKFLSGIGNVYRDTFAQLSFPGLFEYTLALISGLGDVDAITQTFSSSVAEGKVDLSIAAIAITIAVMSNSIVKGSIAWRFGEKEFGRQVMGTFLLSLLLGIGAIIVFSLAR